MGDGKRYRECGKITAAANHDQRIADDKADSGADTFDVLSEMPAAESNCNSQPSGGRRAYARLAHGQSSITDMKRNSAGDVAGEAWIPLSMHYVAIRRTSPSAKDGVRPAIKSSALPGAAAHGPADMPCPQFQ